jgi:hypothetical protein
MLFVVWKCREQDESISKAKTPIFHARNIFYSAEKSGARLRVFVFRAVEGRLVGLEMCCVCALRVDSMKLHVETHTFL